jgi:putative solute:sodium symporter small subunit
MRMAEVVLGLLIVGTAIALAFGAGRLVAPLPPPGLGPTLALVGLGLTLAAHGTAARARDDQRRSAWRAAFYLLLALTLAVSLPLAVDALDKTNVAGFPLGYYLAAQGLLILFAFLAFRAAQFFDERDPAGEER